MEKRKRTFKPAVSDKEIKTAIRKIDDDKLYSIGEVKGLNIILNTNLQPSEFTLYRLIKSGSLKSVNLGTGTKQRAFVKGKDLKVFIAERYAISI